VAECWGSGQIRARAIGMHLVIVSGVEVLHDNEPTGAMPGKIL